MKTVFHESCPDESVELWQPSAEQGSSVTLARTLGRQWREWWRRARGRRELAQLSCRELRDIGVTSLQGRDEWQKPFWRP